MKNLSASFTLALCLGLLTTVTAFAQGKLPRCFLDVTADGNMVGRDRHRTPSRRRAKRLKTSAPSAPAKKASATRAAPFTA